MLLRNCARPKSQARVGHKLSGGQPQAGMVLRRFCTLEVNALNTLIALHLASAPANSLAGCGSSGGVASVRGRHDIVNRGRMATSLPTPPGLSAKLAAQLSILRCSGQLCLDRLIGTLGVSGASPPCMHPASCLPHEPNDIARTPHKPCMSLPWLSHDGQHATSVGSLRH